MIMIKYNLKIVLKQLKELCIKIKNKMEKIVSLLLNFIRW